ncbi:MAG: DUF5615 family PIN-like protein [Dissulfurispiraceae bacterium]
MKFLIDANVPRSTHKIVETLGHDVTDVRDILPSASPDTEVASLALNENRIIITRDQDFANILLYPPERYPGIIVLKVRAMKPSEMNNLIELFLKNNPSEIISHATIILEPNRFRVRR